jgi:hypothetical protein
MHSSSLDATNWYVLDSSGAAIPYGLVVGLQRFRTDSWSRYCMGIGEHKRPGGILEIDFCRMHNSVN